MSDVSLYAVANLVKRRVSALVGFGKLKKHMAECVDEGINVFAGFKPHVLPPVFCDNIAEVAIVGSK